MENTKQFKIIFTVLVQAINSREALEIAKEISSDIEMNLESDDLEEDIKFTVEEVK